MTVAELFRKHRKGEVTEQKFLYEVRRDQNLPFITNMTSYADAIKILKNRGIISETAVNKSDYVNPHQLRRGAEQELLKMNSLSDVNYLKAMDKATKKLAKDGNAYRHTQFANYDKIAKADARLGMTPVKKDNHKDPHNQMKKVSGVEEAKKNTKSSTKENRKGKPKGVKEMTYNAKKAKGIVKVMEKTGSPKIVKEDVQVLTSLLKKKVKLAEDTHYSYGIGQEVHLPEADVKKFKSQTGKVTGIRGGTLELEISVPNQEPLTLHRQVNVIDKAKELAGIKSQEADKAARDKMWSDWDKRGEKTFGGIADFPSKIDAEKQKKMSGLVEKLRNALGLNKKKKKDVDEATKFKAGGETIFKSDMDAQGFEQDLKKAGVRYIKSKTQ